MKRSLLMLGAALLVGCGKEAPPKKELTQRQKDSVVAASRLPGAQGVGAAMRVSDSAAARRARIDSASQDH
jgi:hypothetical protein